MGSFARPNWTEEEIIKLKELCDSGLYCFDKIALLIGHSKSGTMYKCYERKFNNKYRHHLYSYNKSFFHEITYKTCYWAAIITTDGSILWKKEYPSVQWGTAIKDMEHVELYKKTIESNHVIRKLNAKCGPISKTPDTRFPNCYIRIEGAYEWVKDLEKNFGITKNKIYRCPPPLLPTLKHKLCFLRGFIDGDGSITQSNQQGAIAIMVCGINREMIAYIKTVVDSLNLPIARTKGRESLIYQPKGENCYYFVVRGFKAAILFELLRKLPTPNLSRKWDNPRIIEIVNYWKSRKDIWPPELFFENLLIEPTNPTNQPPNLVYTQDSNLLSIG